MKRIKAVLLRQRGLGVTLACAIVLWTGCGGGGENSTPSIRPSGGTAAGGAAPTKSTGGNKAPDVDGCSLVTRSEADAIMGQLREAPKPVTALRDEKTCSYLNGDGASVTIRVYGAEQFELQKGIDSEEKMVSLPGLGDEAYYTKKGTDTDLWARKGSATLNVNGSIGLEKAKGMAQKALNRL